MAGRSFCEPRAASGPAEAKRFGSKTSQRISLQSSKSAQCIAACPQQGPLSTRSRKRTTAVSAGSSGLMKTMPAFTGSKKPWQQMDSPSFFKDS